jgi:hypothetical protein
MFHLNILLSQGNDGTTVQINPQPLRSTSSVIRFSFSAYAAI